MARSGIGRWCPAQEDRGDRAAQLVVFHDVVRDARELDAERLSHEPKLASIGWEFRKQTI